MIRKATNKCPRCIEISLVHEIYFIYYIQDTTILSVGRNMTKSTYFYNKKNKEYLLI